MEHRYCQKLGNDQCRYQLVTLNETQRAHHIPQKRKAEFGQGRIAPELTVGGGGPLNGQADGSPAKASMLPNISSKRDSRARQAWEQDHESGRTGDDTLKLLNGVEVSPLTTESSLIEDTLAAEEMTEA
eukprot:SAG31_NODE_14857_length_784_cov_0.808759_1_plen_128_part_01